MAFAAFPSSPSAVSILVASFSVVTMIFGVGIESNSLLILSMSLGVNMWWSANASCFIDLQSGARSFARRVGEAMPVRSSTF